MRASYENIALDKIRHATLSQKWENVIGREVCDVSLLPSAPRDDGHVYESTVTEGMSKGAWYQRVVPMRLGSNYPISDADPLIHFSTNPRGILHDTYENA